MARFGQQLSVFMFSHFFSSFFYDAAQQTTSFRLDFKAKRVVAPPFSLSLKRFNDRSKMSGQQPVNSLHKIFANVHYFLRVFSLDTGLFFI
jgi:hypothetical protein